MKEIDAIIERVELCLSEMNHFTDKIESKAEACREAISQMNATINELKEEAND